MTEKDKYSNISAAEDGPDDLTEPLAQEYRNKDFGNEFDHVQGSYDRGRVNIYRDSFFALVFLIHVFIILLLAIIGGIPALNDGTVNQISIDTAGNKSEVSDGDNPIPIVLSLMAIMIVAASASYFSLKILVRYGESIIRFGFLFSVVCFVIIAGAAASIGQLLLSFFMVIAAALTYLYYFFINDHIEFAGKNLKVACVAVKNMPSIVTASLGLLFGQVFWCSVWSLALIGIATNFNAFITGSDGTKYDPETCISYSTKSPNPSFSPTCTFASEEALCYKCECNGTLVFDGSECRSESVNAGMYIILLFSLFWGCSVISNISHCVTAGAVASWWFARPSIYGGVDQNPVTNSLKRACTTSFGSICLASLLLATAQILKLLASTFRRSRRGMGALGAALLECFASAAESIVRIFNRYTLCQVSIYGTTLTRAGVEIWNLFKRRGWIAIINDNLCENVLMLNCIVLSAFCGLFGALAGIIFGMSSMATAILVSFGVFTGYNLCAVTMKVVSSALATVLVCFAQDHVALSISNPDLWLELMQSWHKMHGATMVSCGYNLP